MILSNLVYIMLFSALAGGSVNYLLPSNKSADNKSFLQPWLHCVILGLGATLLVPLFLELSQSKIMDEVYFTSSVLKQEQINDKNKKTNDIQYNQSDSTSTDTSQLKPGKKNTDSPSVKQESAQHSYPKYYLLYLAYCMLASSAGFRFINMLINNVVTEEKFQKVKKDKEIAEKEIEKRVKNSQISQVMEAKKIVSQPNFTATKNKTLPVLPRITVPNDPQKNRFGGKPENNFRLLKGAVNPSNLPEYFNVKIWVESTDQQNHPLNDDVVFFVHDSFSPSVYIISPSEFKDNKAIDDEILAYGAFTVGAITDKGLTFLELDLAEDKNFPTLFRSR